MKVGRLRPFMCMEWGICKAAGCVRGCQFPVILTYRYGCDESFVTLLRTRGLGNSPFQLQRKLQEQHHRTWTKQTTVYLSDYKGLTNKTLAVCDPPVKPLPQQPVLKYKWLQKVNCLDVMSCIEEGKASMTSVFGHILKIDLNAISCK